MADPPSNSGTHLDPDDGDGDGAGTQPGQAAMAGAPRWVKTLGVIAIGLVVVFVILQLAGIGGDHGPGRHKSVQSLLTTVTTQGGQRL